MRDEDSRRGNKHYLNKNSPTTFSQEDEEDLVREQTLYLGDEKAFSDDESILFTQTELDPLSMIESFN